MNAPFRKAILEKFPGKKFITVVRVPYGNSNTLPIMREYRFPGSNGAVGIRKELYLWAKTRRRSLKSYSGFYLLDHLSKDSLVLFFDGRIENAEITKERNHEE